MLLTFLGSLYVLLFLVYLHGISTMVLFCECVNALNFVKFIVNLHYIRALMSVKILC